MFVSLPSRSENGFDSNLAWAAAASWRARSWVNTAGRDHPRGAGLALLLGLDRRQRMRAFLAERDRRRAAGGRR